MKIAFLHYSCGLINRGSEISTITLAKFLASKNHEVKLYQLGKPGGKENYSVEQIKLPFYPKEAKNISLLGKILARIYFDRNSLIVFLFTLLSVPHLMQDSPDIIVPTNGFWQAVICKQIKFFKGAKIVVIGRAGIGWHDSDNLKAKPDLFIALSKEALIWANKIMPRVNACFLPNAINTNFFLKSAKNLEPILKKPIILSVAALTEYKHLDKLILACTHLKNVSLLIVGQGELYNDLNKLGKKLLGDRFLITNYPHKQMASIYQMVDLFVLISDEREAFGRVFLEAMAFGLPIVAMNLSARKAIIGTQGIYVQNFEQKEIAVAINKGIAKGKSSNLKRQAANFDIAKVGPLYEQELIKILNL